MQKILITGGSGFIGTHIINDIQNQNKEIINIDIASPKNVSHDQFWLKCNILDLGRLTKIFKQFRPTHVIHLAAKSTTIGNSLEDFCDNTMGTRNVIEAIHMASSVQRTIITSSQHVRRPGSGQAKNDLDFVPHGFYGQSKVITEELTRQANLNCIWTIIRPTTIWGPFHPFLPSGLWHYMKKGWYIHPKNDTVIRCYGYVKNAAWQIQQILQSPEDKVNKKIFYIGDEQMSQIIWINKFSNALIGHNVRLLPQKWIHMLAYIGELFKTIGINFPMDNERYFNLTTPNPVPIDPIINNFGKPPYSLEEGIRDTVNWLNSM